MHLKTHTFQKRYGMITLGIFIMVAGFYYFIAPYALIIGGVSGAGLLLSELFDIPISYFVFVFNLVLLLIGWAVLGFKAFYRSIYGSIMFPVFLFILETFSPLFDLPNDYIIPITFGGFLMGLGFGYVIKYGGTSGGTDIPIKILSKKLKFPLSISIYIVDGAIILSGIIFLYETNGIANGLYAILTMIIAGKVADMVVIGSNSLRSVQIITDQPETIKALIYQHIYRGVSIVPIKGGYTAQDKTMLVTVITRNEYYTIRNIIAKVDPQAFVFANPATEIQGDFSSREEDDH
jgi:uncharacterized membrane-anchored protein YitT (DUF2179 family)